MESYLSLPDGCSKHPKCATCPFPDCKAGMKDIKKIDSIISRHEHIKNLRKQKVPISVIQQRTGYKDKATVYKIIREGH